MSLRRFVGPPALAIGFTLAGSIAFGNPAAAAPYQNPGALEQVTTVAHGLACGGWVWGSASSYPPGSGYVSRAGVVDLALAADFYGVSEGPPAPCWVIATVRWQNLDTDTSGSWSTKVIGSAAFPIFSSEYIETGPGRVEFTLSTDLPHNAATTTLTVY